MSDSIDVHGLPAKWREEADELERLHEKQTGFERSFDDHEKAGVLCRAADELEAALRQSGEAVEMSPEFTDFARGAITWVLYNHQGVSSPVGQPLRFALGMGTHGPLGNERIAEAKRYAAWAGRTTDDFHADRQSPATSWLVEALRDAQRSLETIATNAEIDPYMQSFLQVRGYANSRSEAARAALAAHDASFGK